MSQLGETLITIQNELQKLQTTDDYEAWTISYGQLLIDWLRTAILDAELARTNQNRAVRAAMTIACGTCHKHDPLELEALEKCGCTLCAQERVRSLEEILQMLHHS